MTKPVRVDAAAKAELHAAAGWYEEQREGLGGELVSAIDEAMTRVARLGPDCRPVYGVDPDLGVRRVRAKRFPYAVVFIEMPKTIRVIAVMHERRRPGYWKGRID
jgi:plasmid stabilization system protein ParE